MPDYTLESDLKGPVAGVDEAGYGPWAGPVMAAAVILDIQTFPSSLLKALDDSKKLSKSKRESLFQGLYQHQNISCWIGVGEASPQEIDTINIRQATLKAMERAIAHLSSFCAPSSILVDGINIPKVSTPCQTVIKGDSRSFSIAAASIIAKVSRDKIMTKLSLAYPSYGWEKNAGYGTQWHHRALEKYGVTPHHRQTYKPIQEILKSV